MPTSTVFGLSEAEKAALKSDGLEVDRTVFSCYNDNIILFSKIRDGNRRVEGVEIHGASPFKVRQ